jgi:transposase
LEGPSRPRAKSPGLITIDKFHAVRLANQVVSDVRCRRQQEMTGHRGRKGDPLYGARRDLLRAGERLS